MRQSSLNRQNRINRKEDPEAISSTGGSGRLKAVRGGGIGMCTVNGKRKS